MPDRLLFVAILLAGFCGQLHAGNLQVNGGELDVGSTLGCSALSVGPSARLTGIGTITGTVHVAGVVSPGQGSGTNIGTLTVNGSVSFLPGSIFECHAENHTSLDNLVVVNSANGTCAVYVTRSPTAIPLHQSIITGNPASVYSSFSIAGTNSAHWRLEEGGSRNLLVTSLSGDGDGDSLPDWWEMDNFSSRTAASATADADGDLMNNRSEYVAGTDPLDKTSLLAIASAGRSASSDFVLSWHSVSNRTYCIKRTNDVINGFSAPVVSNIAASPPMNTYTDLVGTAQQYFYKVGVQE
ncbi:MAG: hypothetical protein C0404_06095 [Verrucomicrobia bacterium]|nr:hypothetical protein [Verrucomicrobiota bacterium]